MKKKSNKPTPEYDSQRETNVLLDRISRDVKVIAEGHSDVIKKMDNIDTQLKQHEKRFDKLESELGYIRTAVVENGRDIKKLESGQHELKYEVKDINQKLDTVTTDYEKRIQKLEEKVHV